MSIENKKLYPNQRVYRVYKDEMRFGIVEKDVAIKLLSRIEFYIWQDMMNRKINTTYAFSPQEYNNRAGFSISGARQAFNELIKKGFAEAIDKSAVKIHARSILEENKYLYETENKPNLEGEARWI